MHYTEEDLKKYFDELGLDSESAAPLLKVYDKWTINRWLKKIRPVPKHVIMLLRAWVRLKKNHINWHPNTIFLPPQDVEKIITDRILSGRKYHWDIDRQKGTARCENILIGFTSLEEKRFVPATYKEFGKDIEDIVVNKDILEDGIYAYYIADPYERHRNPNYRPFEIVKPKAVKKVVEDEDDYDEDDE